MFPEYQERDRILREISFASYQDYLSSPLWLSIRERAFQEHGRKCVRCGGDANTIHHSRYDKWLLLGATLEGLHPVCSDCHHKAEFTNLNHKRSLLQANEWLGITKRPEKPPERRRKPNPIKERLPKLKMVHGDRKVKAEGDPCHACGTPVIQRTPRSKHRRGQKIAYKWYLYCPKCRRMYMILEAIYELGPNEPPRPRDPDKSYCECGNARSHKLPMCRKCLKKHHMPTKAKWYANRNWPKPEDTTTSHMAELYAEFLVAR